MARPLKSGLDYFPHDVNASSDSRLEPLILLYGCKGYAFYFIHLEYIYKQSDLSLDISDPDIIQVFIQKLKITEAEYNQILKSALKFGLFDKAIYDTNKHLTSDGIRKRGDVVIDKRRLMQQKYEANKTIPDAETSQKLVRNTSETKQKPEVIKKAYGQFKNVHLTDIELKKLSDSFPDINNKIEALSEYKKSHGKAYKDDYATILSWHRKDLKDHPPVTVGASSPAHRKFVDV